MTAQLRNQNIVPVLRVPTQRENPIELVVASYNIHKAIGTDGRRDPDRIVAVLSEIGADLVALQEVDRRFGTRAGVLDLDAVSRVTGLVPVPVRQTARPATGWHGNLLLVRKGTVEAARAMRLPGLEPRGAIVADLWFGSHPLRVIATHLGLLRAARLAQARRLAKEIGGGDGRPTLVMGDLNEWRLGRRCALLPLRRELGEETASLSETRSMRTLWSAATPEGEHTRLVPLQLFRGSFPARFPVLPLDRILACQRAALSPPSVHDTPMARLASDHLPVVARLRLP